MSGFTYSFALDYMLSVIDLAAKAFTTPQDDPTLKKSIEKLSRGSIVKIQADSSGPTSNGSPEDIVNVLEINLDKIEVIMLESLEVPDADACVFNCYAKIYVRLEPADKGILVNGTVSKITMGVSNYLTYLNCGKLKEYIMSPTDLTIDGTITGIRCFTPHELNQQVLLTHSLIFF